MHTIEQLVAVSVTRTVPYERRQEFVPLLDLQEPDDVLEWAEPEYDVWM